MSEITEVAVVGAGLMGAATARALARRGVAVTLFEAREPGHRAGSSHGSARIFRWAYPDPLYVGLAGQARELWRELESAARAPLLRPTRGGAPRGAPAPGGAAAAPPGPRPPGRPPPPPGRRPPRARLGFPRPAPLPPPA